MGKFTGLLLCSDFDGTLQSGRFISKVTQEAVRYFQEHGGRFTLSTGRYPTILREPWATVSINAPMVAMNGALIYDPQTDTRLYEGTLSEDAAPLLERACASLEGIDEMEICMSKQWGSVSRLPHAPGDLASLLRQHPYKVIFRVKKERSEALCRQLAEVAGDRYAISRSWNAGVEWIGADFDKGKTVRRLATLLGADQLICVGDYENDVSMIRAADVGVAMGNAVDCLKQAADRITASVHEDGVAQLIYSL